ncbi:MAG: GSU2403 family nucleotidyltransferase fold protein [Myxococcaceae bacterium]
MPSLYREIPLAGQTAYAELVDQARAVDLESLARLTGSFQRRIIKGHEYVYFGYRDPLGGAQRRAYVGPANDRVNALVSRFEREKAPKRLAPNAQAALALGCAETLPKHYRIVRQLAAYGFFRAGGVLIGTHAFVAMGNMLGVRWLNGERTLDLDFAHAARKVALALPADVRLPVHDALTSLELGLLPIQELSGKTGAQYRNPRDPELRIDFLTTMTRDGNPVTIADLGLVLEPLKFLEFLLEGTTQAALLSKAGACLVNIPAPERYAIHKLIISGERRPAERAKSAKDLEQTAALAQWHLLNGQAGAFNRAFRDALGRGKGWRSRASLGRRTLLKRHPELGAKALWRSS